MAIGNGCILLSREATIYVKPRVERSGTLGKSGTAVTESRQGRHEIRGAHRNRANQLTSMP